MKSPSVQPGAPRPLVLLALLLVFLTGGIRLGEWTLCLELDGRVHSEAGGGDCAADGQGHVDHERLDAALATPALPAGVDCDGCLDITGRSLALCLRNESIGSSAGQALPLLVCLLPTACSTRFVRRAIGGPDFPRASRLSLRSIDSVILTC